MPDLLASLVRDFAQKAVGILVVWVGAHVAPVPVGVQHALSSWVVLTSSAGALFVWTAFTRWLETAQGASTSATYRRAFGRILMLGLAHKPVYQTQAPAAPVVPAVPAA